MVRSNRTFLFDLICNVFIHKNCLFCDSMLCVCFLWKCNNNILIFMRELQFSKFYKVSDRKSMSVRRFYTFRFNAQNILILKNKCGNFGTWLAHFIWKVTFYWLQTTISSNNKRFWIVSTKSNEHNECIFSIPEDLLVFEMNWSFLVLFVFIKRVVSNSL